MEAEVVCHCEAFFQRVQLIIGDPAEVYFFYLDCIKKVH